MLRRLLAQDGALASLPAELSLLAAIGVGAVQLHPLIAPCVAAIVLAKLIIERGMRWPFLPGALALVGLAPGAAPAAWALIALALPLCLAFQQPRGPLPIVGALYEVGALDVQFEMDGVPFLARILYPCAPKRAERSWCGVNSGTAYYNLHLRATLRALVRVSAPRAFDFFFTNWLHLMTHLGLVRTELSDMNATSSDRSGPATLAGPTRLPVVVFSHGLLSTREQYYGTVVGELAARGSVRG